MDLIKRNKPKRLKVIVIMRTVLVGYSIWLHIDDFKCTNNTEWYLFSYVVIKIFLLLSTRWLWINEISIDLSQACISYS